MLHPYDPDLLSSTRHAALMDEAMREAAQLRQQAVGDAVAWLAQAAATRWRRWRASRAAASARARNEPLARTTACHGG